MAAYLTWIRQEVLLFLVGAVFTASFISEHAELDPAILFIAAGFAASNFSKKGDELIHEVELLSKPIYVVFFTLAGAELHLDSLVAMAPYAFGLVAIRMVSLYLGVRLGAAAGNGSPALQRHGWLGFVSQAGVALTLAKMAKNIPKSTAAGAGSPWPRQRWLGQRPLRQRSRSPTFRPA